MKIVQRGIRVVSVGVMLAAWTTIASPQGAGDRLESALEPYQMALLDRAYDAAVTLPLVPHIKNRARAQAQVVETCFALGDAERGLRFAEGIENWRRGVGYATYAKACFERGEHELAEAYLDRAEAVANGVTSQQWRRDRIRVHVAQIRLELGDIAGVARLSRDLVAKEQVPLTVARVRQVPREELEKALASLDAAVETAQFDAVNAALRSTVALYDSFYGDEPLRQRLEDKLRAHWVKSPIAIKFDLVEALVAAAVAHGDQEKAKTLAEEARDLIRDFKWTPDDELKLRSRVATLRAKAGDLVMARRDADAARVFFEATREDIVDMFRAGALLPLAETWVAIGDKDEAREVFSLALEESLVNVNQRPRVMDFAAICCTMAKSMVDPSNELATRLDDVLARFLES